MTPSAARVAVIFAPTGRKASQAGGQAASLTVVNPHHWGVLAPETNRVRASHNYIGPAAAFDTVPWGYG
jgi:hypothetical protein